MAVINQYTSFDGFDVDFKIVAYTCITQCVLSWSWSLLSACFLRVMQKPSQPVNGPETLFDVQSSAVLYFAFVSINLLYNFVVS